MTIHEEAIIWAEGTEFDADELVREWQQHCQAGDDRDASNVGEFQAWCEQVKGIACV